MATLKKIEGKKGVSYKIIVSAGIDSTGKQRRYYSTFTPKAGASEQSGYKAAQKAAFEFEEKIKNGFSPDSKKTFAVYADYVMALKSRTGAKRRTVERYKELLTRINAAIGHIRITDIKPYQLNSFYENLAEEGIRAARGKATAAVDISALMKKKGIKRGEFSRSAGIAENTLRQALNGQTITEATADKIAAALNMSKDELFTVEKDTSPLAGNTMIAYHRVISAVLSQAVKEQIIPTNPASRATPPKVKHKDAEIFTPEEVERIFTALENAPIKWRAIVSLLFVTGGRRGEIAGLKWDNIDFQNNALLIYPTILYSRSAGVYEDTTKTDKPKYIAIPPETTALLREYRAYYEELRKNNGDRWIESGFVFTKENGAPMHPDSITAWLYKAPKKYGLEGIHLNPHKFRHSMASFLIHDGTDVAAVSKRLGHARISTTTDIYAHALRKADEEAAESIGKLIYKKDR